MPRHCHVKVEGQLGATARWYSTYLRVDLVVWTGREALGFPERAFERRPIPAGRTQLFPVIVIAWRAMLIDHSVD